MHNVNTDYALHPLHGYGGVIALTPLLVALLLNPEPNNILTDAVLHMHIHIAINLCLAYTTPNLHV